MTPLSPLFALLIFLISFLTTYLIKISFGLKPPNKQFGSIDGLRGFLAISVFIHHTSVWYDYLQTNSWSEPKSNLFNQLGESSVSLFFMISSFLFISKLLSFKGIQYNWKSFFVGRIFRIVPLYLFSFFIVFLIVFILSGWTIHVPSSDIIKNTVRWLGLGILGQPDINGLYYTATINAFVNWSLLYEWLLYFSLPLVSLLILKQKPAFYYLLAGILFIGFAYCFRDLRLEHILSLLGGAIAPIIIKFNHRKILFNNFVFSVISIFLLFLVIQFRSSSHIIGKLFLILSFTIIALGNDLFGFLKNSTLQMMGEISYSTYLLHGIIIFIMINFSYGLEATKSLSDLEYCWFIFLMTPLIILVSFLTYFFIEKPFILLSIKIRSNLKQYRADALIK